MTTEATIQSATPQVVTTQPCPRCQNAMPVILNYVTWCSHCEWNLYPNRADPPAYSRFEQLLVTLSRRNAKHLFSLMQSSVAQKPRPTAATIFAYVIASCVYILAAGFIVFGLTLLFTYGRTYIVALIAGLICLGMVWVGRPRWQPRPKGVIPRTSAPTLYAQVDSISQALGVSPVKGIIVTRDYTAAFSQHGWRGDQYLWLGLPLWAVLEPQEQISLLAHELAHSKNGDPQRSRFLHPALVLLQHWQNIVRPQTFWGSGEGPAALFALPFRLIGLLLSGLIDIVLMLLALLLWRTMQHAEYWADHIASRVSGTAATVTLLEKLHLEQAIGLLLERATWRGYANNASNFINDIRQTLARLPDKERERLRRISQLEDVRISTTHPPTRYRVEYLKEHAHPTPSIIGTTDISTRLLKELIDNW